MGLEVTNHLRAESDDCMITIFMGGWADNSGRCDLPTRDLRIYFSPFDDFQLRTGVTDQGHVVNLSGYDDPSARGTNQGWNRFTYRLLTGFQVRDLQSFTWRAEHRGHHFEIRAERIDDTRWIIEYCSDCTNTEYENEMVEYESLLKSWFKIIDPDTFEIVKAGTLISLASAAGQASQIVDYRVKRGYHPQMFHQIKHFAAEQGIDVGKCFGASCIINGDSSEKVEPLPWWTMMMKLPPSEDCPSFREVDNDVLLDWKLYHVDILFARYGEDLPERFRGRSCIAREDQIVEELVMIGQEVHSILGKPPNFSFRPYMTYVNWRPMNVNLSGIEDRVLARASEQLGWTMN